MGLDCTFDAWHGSCSSFNRFRETLLEAIGGEVIQSPKTGIEYYMWGDRWEDKKYEGLHQFILHPDNTGYIHYKTCKKLADNFREILPLAEKYDNEHPSFIEYNTLVYNINNFIRACDKCYELRKNLKFSG